MKKRIQGFILGIVFTICIGMIPAFAQNVWQNISVLVNDVTVAVNGEVKNVPNFVYNDTTYISLRSVSELLGYDVDYDEKTNVALLTAPGKEKVWPKTTGDVEVVENPQLKINDITFPSDIIELTQKVFKTNSPNATQQQVNESVINEFKTRAFVSETVKKAGINIDTSDYDEKYAEYVAQYGDQSKFEEILKQYGLTKEDDRKIFDSNETFNREIQECVNYYKKTDESIIRVKAEARQKYDSDKNLSSVKTAVVKHILIPTTDSNGVQLSAEELEGARTKAQGILSKLKRGESFESLLKLNNNDPGQPDEGYTVTPNSNFVKEFEDAALNLKSGEYSTLVETNYGFHIIKCLNASTISVDFDTYFDNNYSSQINTIIDSLLTSWVQTATVETNLK